MVQNKIVFIGDCGHVGLQLCLALCQSDFETIALDEPFTHDVQMRVPDVTKSSKLLGFQTKTSLDQMLKLVIQRAKNALDDGLI